MMCNCEGPGHYHCGCGARLLPFPLGAITDKTVYAHSNLDRLENKWKRGKRPIHDVVGRSGEILERGMCTDK